MAHLFESFRLRDIVLPNRIGMSPMCQYSAQEGVVTDWHGVHYGSRALGGVGLMMLEATAVAPEGRISTGDLGLWNEEQAAHLEPIVHFAADRGCITGIQLAHAGRKASVGLGWQPQHTLPESEGGWMPLAPSALPFGEGYAAPQALDEAGIRNVVEHFVAATRRALDIGFQIVEIHAAHGYLLHQFLSPLANQRTDRYGGSFDNRTRLVREITAAVRAEWPERLPLMIRLSATDWVEGGWNVDETVELCRLLKGLGVDMVDVSSGGLVPTAKIPVGPGFQVPFATRVKQEADVGGRDHS